MKRLKLAEYVWLDGNQPTQQIRSKGRVVELTDTPTIDDFPDWGFDGSSTNQAAGDSSDCILKPVTFIKDPVRRDGDFIVMCEVYNADGTPHETNGRAKLRQIMAAGGDAHKPWIGFEQEYTLFQNRQPLGWPDNGFPGPQGPYYCGVGAEEIFGRPLAEEHAIKCIEAGIFYYGLNAEVMPGQWEFQIGHRGVSGEEADVLTTSDHLWLARWLLYRLGEEYGIRVSFDNKPIKGDWNGAGMHTNFSTTKTRDPQTGKETIDNAVKALEQKHSQHIPVYGDKLEERLTGLHETCDIHTFKSGVSDRGASIRIPQEVALKGYGYFEDRRPGANANPYLVSAALVASVCGIDTDYQSFLPNVS